MKKKEHSFGVIPVRQHNGKWEILLVHHQAGHWSFPKGHPEEGETPLESAKRELFEETGLHIHRLLLDEPLDEHYMFKHEGILIDKTVSYFLAEAKGKIIVQEDELADARWFSFEEAASILTFPEAKRLLQLVIKRLQAE